MVVHKTLNVNLNAILVLPSQGISLLYYHKLQKIALGHIRRNLGWYPIDTIKHQRNISNLSRIRSIISLI